MSPTRAPTAPEETRPRTRAPPSVTIILDGRTSDLLAGPAPTSVARGSAPVRSDLPFACKGGVCGTCRALLLEGTVAMDVNYALEPDEIEGGYVLTCQSHPTTPTR